MKKALFLLLLAYSIAHFGYSVLRYNTIVYNSGYQELEAIDWKLPAKELLQTKADYYLPLYYALLVPVKWLNLDGRGVSHLSYFTQFILLYWALLLMVKVVSLSRIPSRMEYGIAFILTVNFQPFLELVALHSVEGKELLLICLAIYAFRRKWDALAGALLFLAANLKYLPGILIGYFLLKREYRVLAGVGVASVISVLAMLPILGLDGLWAYQIDYPLRLMFSPQVESNFVYGNVEWQTVSGTVNRLFSYVTPPHTFEYLLQTGVFPTAHPAWAFTIAMLMKVVLIGLYLAFVLRRRWSVKERETAWPFYLLEISMTLLMILVIVQAIRVHYCILFLPAFVFVALLIAQRWELFRAREKLLLGVAYGLCGRIILSGLLDRLPRHPLWGQDYANMYLWLSLPFYGYGMLAACIFLCARRLQRAQGPEPGS